MKEGEQHFYCKLDKLEYEDLKQLVENPHSIAPKQKALTR